jgi:predicted peroxiredoxin
MPVVPGLTIIVAGADQERFHAALSLAAANAALGRRTRLFLQGEAAALLRQPPAARDTERSAAGVPTIADLVAETVGLGVEIIACQSGLALAGIAAEDLPAHVATGGLVALLSTRGDDELVMA